MIRVGVGWNEAETGMRSAPMRESKLGWDGVGKVVMKDWTRSRAAGSFCRGMVGMVKDQGEGGFRNAVSCWA